MECGSTLRVTSITVRIRMAENQYLMTGQKARWSVMWYSTKKKRVFEVEYDHDLNGAIELYMKVKAQGKKMATLCSPNVAFPPPEKYLPHTKTVVTKKKITRNGKTRTKKIRTEVEVVPMREVNLKGITWCPYCREFRKFRKQDGFTLDGRFVATPGLHCPMCGNSHRNHHVRKYNPSMELLSYRPLKAPRARRSSSNGKRRRRTR